MNAQTLGHQIDSKANANGIHGAFSCRGFGLVSSILVENHDTQEGTPLVNDLSREDVVTLLSATGGA